MCCLLNAQVEEFHAADSVSGDVSLNEDPWVSWAGSAVTLLKIMGSIIRPVGWIDVDDPRAHVRPARTRCQFPQDLTGRENVFLNTSIWA